MSDPLSFISVGGLAALLAAAAALFSAHYSRQQTTASLKVANKQIVAPMRQQWIETLRDAIAELVSESYFHFVKTNEFFVTDGNAKDTSRRRMLFLEQKIRLMINPKEADHQRLVEAVHAFVAISEGRAPSETWQDANSELTEVARRVFKAEWDRVKSELN